MCVEFSRLFYADPHYSNCIMDVPMYIHAYAHVYISLYKSATKGTGHLVANGQ